MTHRARLRRAEVLAVALSIVLAVAACGSGSQGASGSAAAAAQPSSAASGSPAATGPSPQGASSPAGGTPPAGQGAAASENPPETWERIPGIVDATQPSVVTIVRQGAEGSGVVWSADGVIVTNNHVVEGANTVEIRFADATRANADVVATDPLSDLAIVKANRTGLPAATFSTVPPEVGALAIAMGNPLGFENSVTAGIVSGLHRSIPNAAAQAPALIDLIQTDAAISPGNSGGALVGGDGRVMGINVAFIPPNARAVSIGFAIPSTFATDIVTKLLADGHVDHAALGVRLLDLTPQIVQQFNLQASEGALVADVLSGGPADRAGIQAGDIVTQLDGQPIRTSEDLLAALRAHNPGDRVRVTLTRDGTQEQVDLVLGELTQ